MPAMLRYRLIFGPIMILALAGMFYLDEWLGQLPIRGQLMQSLFPGRNYLPAGIIMLVLFLTLIAFGARELTAIFRAKNIPAQSGMVALAGLVGCAMIYIIPHNLDATTAMAVLATLVVGIFLVTLVRYSYLGRIEGAVAVAAVTMFALIYMGLLPGFYLAIRRWHSAWIVAAIILTTKSCDIGAYFTGKAIGRHKLIVWLSPGKTWEGLIGGILFSGLVALGLAALLNHFQLAGHYAFPEPNATARTFIHKPYPLPAAAVAGVFIGLIGQFGDLTASLFKRDAGIKDSGSSIPGYGGLLDVVDSPIVVAPFAYWILALAR